MVLICLQGGAEFTPGCDAMDADLVRRAGGPVVVTALAGAPGRDYATATANGVRHFAALSGAEVIAAPDAREDPGALAVIRRARLLVLPGGSPSRLLAALQSTGVDQVVRELVQDGAAVMGSSAGAMVLGDWTVLPEGPGPELAPGLGVVPGVVVVPHWGGDRPDWLAAVRAHPQASGAEVLGIPEQSGIVLDEGSMSAVGRRPVRLVRAGRNLDSGQTADRHVGSGAGGPAATGTGG